MVFIDPIAFGASPGQVGNITFFQTASRRQLVCVFYGSLWFWCPKWSQNEPWRGTNKGLFWDPGAQRFPKRSQEGVQASKSCQNEARGCPNEVQNEVPRFPKSEVFDTLDDLQHLKNAGIPSSVLTTWCICSGGRVHCALSAPDWKFENWRALRFVWRPILACIREPEVPPPRDHRTARWRDLRSSWISIDFIYIYMYIYILYITLCKYPYLNVYSIRYL